MSSSSSSSDSSLAGAAAAAAGASEAAGAAAAAAAANFSGSAKNSLSVAASLNSTPVTAAIASKFLNPLTNEWGAEAKVG